MKRKLIILSAALLCAALCVCGCGNNTIEKLLEEGKIALASSEYDKAEKLFKLACDSDGSNGEAVQYYNLVSGYNKAQEYADNKEYDKSEKQINDLKSSHKYDSIKKDVEKLEKEIKNIEDKENAKENYLKFLTLGGSMYPIDELKVAGVDMTKPEVIEKAINMFNDIIDEFKEVYNS